MLKKRTSKQWLIMTALLACVTYTWLVIGDVWINPTLLFAGALVFTSGAVLSFSLVLARAVRLKGVKFKMMLVSVVVTLALSAGAVYGVYQIVA
ncbi:hypothetical protein [Exiguobacterium sp. UBA6309]|uniref:hypothetical protein n=1 Tax=Exiguobacterium sp. UBA6309 TaxID=1946499 RepID=UPI0025BFD1FB|nr:hypothetical protein [Exiguobacterium sp. UBA6309]